MGVFAKRLHVSKTSNIRNNANMSFTIRSEKAQSKKEARSCYLFIILNKHFEKLP